MEWEWWESIEYWTHYVTWNFNLTYDIELRFSRSNAEIFDPHPWSWPWILKSNFESYLRNGRINYEQKKMRADRMLGPLCDLEPWPWINKFKFWQSHISRMGGSIGMERKVCELIGCWIYFVTWNFDIGWCFVQHNVECQILVTIVK